MQAEEPSFLISSLLNRPYEIPADIRRPRGAREAELEEVRQAVRFDSRFNPKHDYSNPRFRKDNNGNKNNDQAPKS